MVFISKHKWMEALLAIFTACKSPLPNWCETRMVVADPIPKASMNVRSAIWLAI